MTRTAYQRHTNRTNRVRSILSELEKYAADDVNPLNGSKGIPGSQQLPLTSGNVPPSPPSSGNAPQPQPLAATPLPVGGPSNKLPPLFPEEAVTPSAPPKVQTPEPPKTYFKYTPVSAPEDQTLKLREEKLPETPGELIPELQQLKSNLLRTDSQEFKNFRAKYDTYRSAAQFLFKEKNYDALKQYHPEVHRAIEWVRGVKAGTIDPYANPEEAKQNIRTLWELGAYNYATKGFQVSPDTQEGRNYITARYVDVFNKALGDKTLDADDLNLVYNNFSKVVGMPPANPATVSTFWNWWNSDNVNPLYKAGLMLGIPLTIVGLVSGLWKGWSTGSVLMTLLGGLGTLMGLGSYFGHQTAQERTTSPYGWSTQELLPSEPKPEDKTESVPTAPSPSAKAPEPTAEIRTNLAGINEALDRIAQNPGQVDPEQVKREIAPLHRLTQLLYQYQIPASGVGNTIMGWLGMDVNTVWRTQLAKLNNDIYQMEYAQTPEELAAAANSIREKINTFLTTGIETLANQAIPGNDPDSARRKAQIRAAVYNMPVDQMIKVLESGGGDLNRVLAQLERYGSNPALFRGGTMW